MNIESVRDYCLSLPHVTEDFPFDETTLVFRIGGKIFAMIDLEKTEWFVLKCEPEYALELREYHQEISPAWHMNKKHWIGLELKSDVPDDEIRRLVHQAYSLVAARLTKSAKRAIGLL